MEINNSNTNNPNVERYRSHYSEKGLWKKVANHYKKVGVKLIEIAISMYYSLRDDDTPSWAKNIMLGALGYFILPIDIIPDIVPIVGFSDDIAAITLAVATVTIHIKDEHKEKAKQKMNAFFNKQS